MKLRVERYSSGEKSTLGLLFIDDVFQCHTCEDQHQEAEKVYGETRIPAGTYRLTLRTDGGFDERYARKYPEMHKGMLWLQDVPSFEYILIHVGNTDDDSAGCLLVGAGANSNPAGGGRVTSSVAAYKRFYPPIAAALLANESVSIEIIDRDRR